MKKLIILLLIIFCSSPCFAQNTDEHPTQKKNNQIRKESDVIVSFMSFTADTTKNDIISYLKESGLDYKLITHFTNRGSVDYETYRIEDINYKNCDFNYIDIDIDPKNGTVQKYDKLLRIICFPLTDNDFLSYEKIIKDTYNYSIKEKLYYGKSRFYSTKEINKYNSEYEGENSGYIYYDEITVNTINKSILYDFTVQHNYIIPVNDVSKYTPFETEQEIINAATETNGTIQHISSIPSRDGNRYIFETITFKEKDGKKTLYIMFQNCSTFESVLMTTQEAFDLLILDGHPFGKEKK